MVFWCLSLLFLFFLQGLEDSPRLWIKKFHLKASLFSLLRQPTTFYSHTDNLSVSEYIVFYILVFYLYSVCTFYQLTLVSCFDVYSQRWQIKCLLVTSTEMLQNGKLKKYVLTLTFIKSSNIFCHHISLSYFNVLLLSVRLCVCPSIFLELQNVKILEMHQIIDWHLMFTMLLCRNNQLKMFVADLCSCLIFCSSEYFGNYLLCYCYFIMPWLSILISPKYPS